jgi:hypothetical protein
MRIMFTMAIKKFIAEIKIETDVERELPSV